MSDSNPIPPDEKDSSDLEAPTQLSRGLDATEPELEEAFSSGSLIGKKLSDFQVLRKLGRGGMAEVYVARQLSLGRDVALKVLKNEFARDKDYVARFRREARAAAKLNHPNIVQVYDVGSANAMHYIAQELVNGENLKEELARVGSLETGEAVEVLVGVASALEVASEAGITHRDIKPENIMRSSRGIIKVADFGLARLGTDAGASRADLTQAGLTLGTPRYMSPEQVQGQVADVRSDLYSLGVTMYHLLAGRPPFEADDPLALAVLHLHETPMPLDRARGRKGKDDPGLPEWLIAIVGRLMQKLPKDRIQSPSELLDAVRNEASESSVQGFGTVGTAAATIRLQRVTDEQTRNRRKRLARYASIVALPLICIAIAAASAMSQSGKNVPTLLVPDVVPEAESIQEQYLIGAIRDDAAGWQAVLDYFPDENSTSKSYRAKATLQLSRLYASEQRLRDADRALNSILRDASVDRLYQAIALARRCEILEQVDFGERLGDTLKRLKSLYLELQQDNPEAVEVFDDVIGEEQLLNLGLRNTASKT